MAELTLEEVVAAAQKLAPAQKAFLVQTLQGRGTHSLTRDELITETEALRTAGAFDHLEKLADKFYNPALSKLSDEELRATIHEAATEWVKGLDEHFANED